MPETSETDSTTLHSNTMEQVGSVCRQTASPDTEKDISGSVAQESSPGDGKSFLLLSWKIPTMDASLTGWGRVLDSIFSAENIVAKAQESLYSLYTSHYITDQ